MTATTTAPIGPRSRLTAMSRVILAILIVLLSTFSAAKLFHFTLGIKFDYLTLLAKVADDWEAALALAAKYIEPHIKELIDRWLQLSIKFDPAWKHVFVIMFACYIWRDFLNYWKLTYKTGAIIRLTAGFLFSFVASLVVGLLPNLDLPTGPLITITVFLLSFFALADVVGGIAGTTSSSRAGLSKKRWLLYFASALALVAAATLLISPPQTAILHFLISAIPLLFLYLYYLLAHATDTFVHRAAILQFLKGPDESPFSFFFSRARRWTAVYNVGVLVAAGTFLILQAVTPNAGLSLLVFLLIGLGLYFLYRAWDSTKAPLPQFVLVLFGFKKVDFAGNLALGREMLKPFFLAATALAIDSFLVALLT